MLPALVLPFHDPSGVLLRQLATIMPTVQQFFSHAFLSISPITQHIQAEQVQHLQVDSFFILNANAPNSLPGDHYMAAYASAVCHSHPDQVLHLCDIDKLAAIVQSQFHDQFLADITACDIGATPTLFQRSPLAWSSYPQPYREIEQIAITLGQYLFRRYLDFAWSYLIISSAQLQAILPHIQQRTFGLLAEIVLLLQDRLQTQDVDWLFWEDPFIEGRDRDELRKEREGSEQETRKRLMSNAPIIRLLLDRI
ncbi:MAG TPA: hypothetical protein VFO07_15975 [Roseiflexaceae bacterium]|nr:hypothetical protein [Roseiflexaceae bacterium]